MKKSVLVAIAAVVLAHAAGYALGRRSVSPGLLRDGPGPAVATFRGGVVTRADVEALLAGQPEGFRGQLRDPAARKALVTELVRFEVLAREAERRGYQGDPELLRRYKDELGRVLLERELEAPQRKTPPTDAEVRAFFDQHEKALGRPDRVRVAAVSYVAPAEDAGARAKKRGKAEAALARLRTAKDPFAFADVVRADSDDVEARLVNGEQPFRTREDLAQRLGPEVADAAFAPGANGLLPRVVETPRGLHVVKVLGREAGYAPSFDELREVIRTRLSTDRRAAARKAFLDQLWKDAQVTLDEKAIDQLRVE